MQLRVVLLALVIFACSLFSLGQQRVVFIIDTLLIESADFNAYYFRKEGASTPWMKEPVAGSIALSTYPNYVAQIAIMTGHPIHVPLTHDEGFLRIHLADQNHLDTIRIDKYELLRHCSYDSVATTISWSRLTDSPDVIIRSEHSIKPINKRPCQSRVQEIHLTINGKAMTIPIHLQKDLQAVEVMHFHGYKPRKCAGKSIEDRGAHRCLRMYGTSNSWAWRLSGEAFLR